jgi:hypothetical protein
MKITASVFGLCHIAQRALCTDLRKFRPKCEFANTLAFHGRTVPAPSDALHSALLTMFPIAEGRHRQADPPLI